MHQVSKADQASSPVRLEAIFIKYPGGGESMGLSYAQEYSCRDHFRQRAFERFGVDDQHLNRWINQHLPSLSPYDSNVVQPANTEAYVASDGVIFVCNIKSREFITCFRRLITKNLRKKRKPIRTFTKTMSLPSKKDVNHLVNRYRLKEPKSCLKTLGRTWMTFIACPKQSRTANWANENSKRLEELLGKFHVIKAAMRIIENKRGRLPSLGSFSPLKVGA